ncbi:hypothetical protein [Bradyrhizobium sp. Tv2a-2]|uniref:hypothetical protein n=1 Tax=Bradyrhizobium sp. Tv2a-2 TaxID=113395 RepID=UPI0012EC49E9|nr:hypothetical protein [Bradyrhizobium sp. Tv2a-2]
MQNAIEKRCIVCRCFVVCQFLAAWRRSLSKLACPAAIGDRPRFATAGVLLGRSPSVVQQTGEPWRFIATADSQRFDASADNGARSPDVSTARYHCPAGIGDRQSFAATGRQKRFSASGDRRRSSANSDRQRFGTIGSHHELATACQ